MAKGIGDDVVRLVGGRLLLAVGDVHTSLPHFISFLCRLVEFSLRNTFMTESHFGEGAAAAA